MSELCHCKGKGFGFINVHFSGDSKELTFQVHRLHFIVGPMESENENLVIEIIILGGSSDGDFKISGEVLESLRSLHDAKGVASFRGPHMKDGGGSTTRQQNY